MTEDFVLRSALEMIADGSTPDLISRSPAEIARAALAEIDAMRSARNASRSRTEMQDAATLEEVEAAAKVLWEDQHARYGGPWPGELSSTSAAARSMTVARAVLDSADLDKSVVIDERRIDMAAEVLWESTNDPGTGPLSSRNPLDVCVLQTRATAKAMLQATVVAAWKSTRRQIGNSGNG